MLYVNTSNSIDQLGALNIAIIELYQLKIQ